MGTKQSKQHNPGVCSQWTASFLAAECRRYGKMADSSRDGLVTAAFLCQAEVIKLVDEWLVYREWQQFSVLRPFSWFVADDPKKVPSTYLGIVTQVLDNNLLWVSPDHCETSYWGQAVNVRLRAVHDTDHVLQELTLSVDDEIRLGLLHASMLYTFLLNDGTTSKRTAALCALVLAIDTAGQAFYSHLCGPDGGFVPDQQLFLKSCLKHGVLTGARKYYNEVHHG